MMKSFIHFLLFDCLSFKTLKIKQFQNINQFQTVKSNYEMSIIFCGISLSNTSYFYVWYWWDIVFLWFKTQARMQRLVSFCISVVSLILKYTGVFSEKINVFFRHFLGCHLVNLTKKINFWKMKKKLLKIFKNGRFFAHLWAERPQCQHPDFWGPLFEHFHKVNDQNWVIEKIGIKGYPLYIQKIWPHFWPLFERYFLNP